MDSLRRLRDPKNFTETQSLMGSLNYYKRFIPELSSCIRCFSNVLRKEKFEWLAQQQEAMNYVKELLEQKLMTFHPPIDQKLYLCIGFGPVSISNCLYFNKEDPKIISFGSKMLNEAQMKYSKIERLFFGVAWSVQYYRQYLEN